MQESHSSPSSDSAGRDSPTNPNQPLQHSRSVSPSSTGRHKMEHRDEKKISDAHLANNGSSTGDAKAGVKAKDLPAENVNGTTGGGSGGGASGAGKVKGRAKEGKHRGKAKGKGGDDGGSKRHQQHRQQQHQHQQSPHPPTPQAQHQSQQTQLQTRGFKVRIRQVARPQSTAMPQRAADPRLT